jgi:hypothetical protein
MYWNVQEPPLPKAIHLESGGAGHQYFPCIIEALKLAMAGCNPSPFNEHIGAINI